MLSKDEKRKFVRQRRLIRLNESASAVADILELWKCDRAGSTMHTKDLWEYVEDQARIGRKKFTKDGKQFLCVPTVNNRSVRLPNVPFCRNNWRDIKIFAAECGYYIVSRIPGDPTGVRLGSLEEFVECQTLYETSVQGMADTHNERATTVQPEVKGKLPKIVVEIRAFIKEQEVQS